MKIDKELKDIFTRLRDPEDAAKIAERYRRAELTIRRAFETGEARMEIIKEMAEYFREKQKEIDNLKKQLL